MSEKIWSFDIGTGSLGYAVRGARGNQFEFDKVQSLLIPDDFASTKPAAEKRRAKKTRESHKKREEWLVKVFEEAGLEVLHGRKLQKVKGKKWQLSQEGDERLEKEFPKSGDDTVFCGALLRIMLLQGKELEEWQVFKAFHSAIQKRGYDSELPWKANSGTKKDDDSETKKRADSMEREIMSMSDNSEYHYPCYWEAYRMGLWNPKTPDTWNVRINHRAETTKYRKSKDPIELEKESTKKKKATEKNQTYKPSEIQPVIAVYPRKMVEKEIRDMFAEAEKQYPSLKKIDDLLYGPTGKSYASYHAERGNKELYNKAGGRKNLLRGKETDLQGVLSQKIPTFDNRSPNKCILIPRLNVCRAAPKFVNKKLDEDSLLAAEVTFLLKLKNTRFSTAKEQRGFTVQEIKEIFESRVKKAKNVKEDPGKVVEQLKLTKPQLQKEIKKFVGTDTDTIVNHEKIKPPKSSGRSRFSRPALKIIKDLLLSGKSPKEFASDRDFQEKFVGNNTDRRKGLIEEDLEFLNHIMVDKWEEIYIPNETLSEYNSFTKKDKEVRENQIRKIIGERKDPIVRHRLGTFYKYLKKLEGEFDSPDRVVIEFVREDWMRGNSPEAKERKQKYKKDIKNREEENSEAHKDLQEQGRSTTRNNILKWKLHKEQDKKCIFCDSYITFSESDSVGQSKNFDEAQAAHIVPDSHNGPKTYLNLVLACQDCNAFQKDKYHYDWIKDNNRGWDAFVKRVEKTTWAFSSEDLSAWDAFVKRVEKTTIKPHKKELLCTKSLDKAAKMIDNRVKLQQTAEITKLAQTIVCLYFGWQLDFAGQERKVTVLNGALTDRVARRYNLHTLLRNQENEKFPKKDRNDKRHHALDAMIMSFIPNWARNSKEDVLYRLPKKVENRDPIKFFGEYLEKVVPHNIHFQKPKLRETIYGERKDNDGTTPIATIKVPLLELGEDSKHKWDGKMKLRAERIMDETAKKKVLDWIGSRDNIRQEEWKEFCQDFSITPNGSIIKKIRCKEQQHTIEDQETGVKNFADLSKDKTGQLRTRKESDQGQFVYLDTNNQVKVRPVRVFESKFKVKGELIKQEDYSALYGFFQSGCLISLEQPVVQARSKREIPKGEYRLNTIKTGKTIKFTSSKGEQYVLSLSAFLITDRSKKRFVLKRIQ